MRKQIGVTLLEIMLVLAVAGSILVFAIKQYQQIEDQKDLRQLQLNIDKLFMALGHYYQAYCGKGLALDPALGPPDPFPMSPTTLITNGFLSANWNAIDVPFASSYVGQLNLKAATNQNVYACWNFGTYTCGALSQLPGSASVYIWTVQVAVQLKSSVNAQAYKALTGADCVSTSNGTTVTPCATSGNTGTYLVWERLPSLASPNLSSNLWMSMPQLKQFNMQYSHDMMYELSNGPNATTGTSGAQPYLCGG